MVASAQVTAQNKRDTNLKIPPRELRAIQRFNTAGVEYLLTGGYAVKFYCPSRVANDVDLLVRAEPNNAERMFLAIQAIVGHAPAFGPEKLALPKKQVRFCGDGLDLELLTSQPGVEFSDAVERQELAVQEDIVIPVLSAPDLIRVKTAVAKLYPRRRRQELADLALLREACACPSSRRLPALGSQRGRRGPTSSTRRKTAEAD
jgi:hypothetical protein